MSVTETPANRVVEEERQELQTVLQSETLRKAPSLQRFLEYIGKKHFAGEADEVKEYSIAVNALNRPSAFDPQNDTIVRVTAHTLRKRLEQYYTTEGASHPVQIQLPAGKYVLRFVRRSEPVVEAVSAESKSALDSGVSVTPATAVPEVNEAELKLASQPVPLAQSPQSLRNWRMWLGIGALIALVAAGVAALLLKRPASQPSSAIPPAPATGVNDRTIRILAGKHSGLYFDTAGRRWMSTGVCQGGTPYNRVGQEVHGTDDPTIFREGREGRFHCRIPVAQGSYELKLLFADTEGYKEAARLVVYTINNGPTQGIDVVDEAGDANMALGKVYAGLHPMSDGTIHLDFLSQDAFLSAIELTPTPTDSPEPLRMLAGPATMLDESGNLWGPEQFFRGGRRTFHADNLPKTANARLFEWERYGHFHYALPVLPDKDYTIRFSFSEGWFGTRNGGPGGSGSRVFNVYCNGTTLLKDFDILREGNDGMSVYTARHVHSTPRGSLELDFEPVVNYSLINAIEVDPEN